MDTAWLSLLTDNLSLMGISKIFKDKPKDEDAALPEKDAKSKKDKKKKKSKGKGDVAEASVSHTTAEHDREVTPSLTEEEDRSLAGLSPAAKLARQHTLRSRAEAAQKEVGKVSGEPTWDNNTTTRHGQSFTAASVEMASASAVVGNGVSPVVGGGSPNLSNVVHVRPRQTPNIVHAVPVPFSDHEYDSEDDSSEGETVEDVAAQFARSRLSDGSADRAFREAWGNAWIDKSAVPKKGILKSESQSVPHHGLTGHDRRSLIRRSGKQGHTPEIQLYRRLDLSSSARTHVIPTHRSRQSRRFPLFDGAPRRFSNGIVTFRNTHHTSHPTSIPDPTAHLFHIHKLIPARTSLTGTQLPIPKPVSQHLCSDLVTCRGLGHATQP